MKLNEVKANPFLLDRLDHTGRQQYYKQGYKGQGVIVCVIDSGINAHAELAGKLITPAQDTKGHGTSCASLIAGTNIGIAPECRILPYKRQDDYLTSIVAGMQYARNWRGPQGEKVNIISLSASSSSNYAGIVEEVKACEAAGILVVCSSGNTGCKDITYPAACDETLTAGAVSNKREFAGWASWGKMLDVVWYGEKVVTASGQDDYMLSDGTSFSTPVVAGMAALWYCKFKSLMGKWPDPRQCKEALMMSAMDLGLPGDDEYFGTGFASLDGHLTTRIQLTINQPSVKVNGYSKAIDQAPMIMPETGRTVVPVRALAEALGCEVSWDPVKQQIDIVGVKA